MDDRKPSANDAGAVLAQARALLGGGRSTDAIALLTEALRATPDALDVSAGLGEILCRNGRFAEAAQHLERVVAADRDHAVSLFYYGVALQGLGAFKPAIVHLRRAIDLQPRLTEGYRALAMTLWTVGAREHAVATLDEARTKAASTGQTEGLCFFFRQSIADWSVFDQSVAWLRAQIAADAQDLEPAICFLLPGVGAAEQLRVGENYGRMIGHLPAPSSSAGRGDKIRIGYLSADFGDHPVGRLMGGILENHDRDRFEVYAYSTRPGGDHPTTVRLRAAADHFVEVHQMSDVDAAARIRSDGIDILIDLGCYTEGGRPRIVAQRPARVHVNYLGMSGTSGHPAYDYIITDDRLTPAPLCANYSETPAYMPEVYLNVDQAAAPPQRDQDRTRWSLPATGFVFCTFNNTVKITPHHFKLWTEILHAVPGSVLWLRDLVAGAKQRIVHEAENAGLDSRRIIFAPAVERAEHLQRLAHADLLLDCFPYNGGSTTADALWSGLPVLTLVGETYVSRMSLSMLHALGLDALAVSDRDAYQAQAIRLATHPAALADLRMRLTERRRGSALFDSARFTRHLDAVLAEMARRSRAGVPHTSPIRIS